MIDGKDVAIGVLSGSLVLSNLFSVVVVFLITRHCYKNTKNCSHTPAETMHAPLEKIMQVNVAMIDNPAYGPVDPTLENENMAMQWKVKAQDTGLKIYEDVDTTTSPGY